MEKRKNHARTATATSPAHRGVANIADQSFRVLARQPLSLTFDSPGPFSLAIASKQCQLAFRAAETSDSAQRVVGGTFVVIEFPSRAGTDLLNALREGMDLIEDVMSGLAMVEGVTLGPTEPLQVACADPGTPGKFIFAQVLPLSYNHWDRSISRATMDRIGGLLAHWDGLDTGARLRRAARQFRQAIGEADNLAAFQYAYLGLEAMEKPLAQAIGIQPGVEETAGQCAACGGKYTRRRTVLAGVRAYVQGDAHRGTASEKRKAEWKELSSLRQELFHGLKDLADIEKRIPAALTAAMHYLHDGISCCSHAHDLESREFRLARKGRRPMIMGQFAASGLGPVGEWKPLLGVEEPRGVREGPRVVPEFKINNPGIPELRTAMYWLPGGVNETKLEPIQFKKMPPESHSS